LPEVRRGPRPGVRTGRSGNRTQAPAGALCGHLLWLYAEIWIAVCAVPTTGSAQCVDAEG
jgi:hypothetical protein